MPHRVVTFFRSHANNNSFDPQTELKKTPRRSSSRRPSFSNRTPSSSASSIISEDSKSVNMPDGHGRLLSLTGLHSPKPSSNKLQPQPASLDVLIESPPLVFYGQAATSTGALLSGQLTLDIHDESLAIDAFKMRLACEVTRKKPFHAHCQECQHQSTDLTTWTFLQGPATLRKGEHSFPFSFLLPGRLPASMKGGLSAIEYVLHATVSPKSGAEPIKLSQVLNIKRAIYPSDVPRRSIRIFPPTNLTANVELPPVIHPIGEFTASMRMDGIVKRNPDTKTQTQWKLKRLTWRIDETQKAISPACPKHAAKLGNIDDVKKGIPLQDVRIIGTDEFKSGWKADYSSPDGSIDMEFQFGIRHDTHPVCDLKAEEGTEVSHVLVVEMIVAEEFAPIKKPSQFTPTGAARVLRMHFNLTVTERAGMGISWDEEQPPLYENVPASPPGYGMSDLYEGEPIPDYEDLVPLDAIVETAVHGNGEGPSGSN